MPTSARKVGALASVLELLREAGINIKQMENQIFAGEGAAACARLDLSGTISGTLLDDLRALTAVYDVQQS